MTLKHHSLVAWQRADDLYIRLHQLSIKAFPSFERFELGSQLRRAAYSVAANIVEGFAKRSEKSKRFFLNVAEASLAEVGYCVHVAHRLGYISDAANSELETEIRRTCAPLVGLIRSIRIPDRTRPYPARPTRPT
jgi:four helix bundle protein